MSREQLDELIGQTYQNASNVVLSYGWNPYYRTKNVVCPNVAYRNTVMIFCDDNGRVVKTEYGDPKQEN
jgi:hypothetical protein